MTIRPRQWTRRRFSQALAVGAASTLLPQRENAASSSVDLESFAFVGTSTAEPSDGTVRVYLVRNSKWDEVYAVNTASPAHLVMHPYMPMLYVVHGVATWDNRPRGAVSAYRFDSAAGHLSHAGTQPLGLSATHPRHATVTAHGRALFVAAESGGMYNVLPIAGDGKLQPVSALRKECGLQDGCRSSTAAPRQVALHADGSIYAADPGQETISRFDVSSNGITLQHRSRTQGTGGASHLAFSQSGQVYAMNARDGSIAVHDLTEDGMAPSIDIYAGAGGRGAMRMHPGGRLLVASWDGSLQVFRTHPRNGRLALQDQRQQSLLASLQFASAGTQVAGIDASGAVILHRLDPATGALGSACLAMQPGGATSLLLHTA